MRERKASKRHGLHGAGFPGINSVVSANVLSEPYLTVEEYLASEERSEVKHEYLGGSVYAMAGASESHNRIASNLGRLLNSQLRGRRCESFGSDMRIRIHRQSPDGVYFYYPDAMIACNPADAGHGWREQPAALFEIISESTRQIDEREKRSAYLHLPSLEAYVRIEQGRPEALVEFRTLEGWRRERITGIEGIIRLPTLEIELSLAELYERVQFTTDETV